MTKVGAKGPAEDVARIERVNRNLVRTWESHPDLKGINATLARCSSLRILDENALLDVGIAAISLSSFLIARGGIKLLASDLSGWEDIGNGCFAQYLNIKTAIDRTRVAADVEADPVSTGVTIHDAVFAAGSAYLFPEWIPKADALHWLSIFERISQPYADSEPTRLALTDAMLLKILQTSRTPSDAPKDDTSRQRLIDATTAVARAAGLGLSKKQSPYMDAPSLFVFPAQHVATGQYLRLGANDGTPLHPFLSPAHLTSPGPTTLTATLSELNRKIRESGDLIHRG
jgi:hypothetical protein